MSAAKSLPPVDPFFMQECPLCGASNRMMIRGVYVEKDKIQLHPDMGYSFCNCRDIFYTKPENVTRPGASLNSVLNPIAKLHEIFESTKAGEAIVITMRDPYFVIWTNPHTYTGFNPRENFTLWDAESFISECERVGFELISWRRDMDVESKTPECYHVTLRKL
jgi:hypothetical protein